MTPSNLETAPFEVLRRRLQARVSLGLSLARTHRFVTELEPASGAEPDTVPALIAAFKDWRRALRDRDLEGALDAAERSFARLEEWRTQVAAQDGAIMAYRVLWACENAPLRDQTIDSLARFYRLQPISKSTQSKYEYTLTRLLAGPIGPDRALAPTEDLVDMVETLTASWDAPSFTGEDDEVATILSTLDSFARDATSQTDAATFTARALLRKFGSFKASIWEKIFDPRVAVAVVEANVAVLNALDRLLADAGGHLVKGMQAAMRPPRLLRAHRITAERRRPVFQEGQKTPVADQADTETRAADQVQPAASPAEPHLARTPEEIRPDPGGSRPLTRMDFKTGEVDLSGLEYVFPYGRRKSFPSSDSGIESAGRPEGPDPDDSSPESTSDEPRGQGEDPTGEIAVGPTRTPEAAGSETADVAPKSSLPSPPPPRRKATKSGPSPCRRSSNPRRAPWIWASCQRTQPSSKAIWPRLAPRKSGNWTSMCFWVSPAPGSWRLTRRKGDGPWS